MLMLDRLRPGPLEEVDAAAAYAYPEGQDRHLRANMVASVDGAAALEGRVGTLTGPADQELLLLLRSLCDVLLVGAGTIRAEGYGPVRTLREMEGLRREQGQSRHPRLAVITRSVDVDLRSSAFTEAVERPIVITTELAERERLEAAEEVADVLVAGERTVDFGVVSDLLVERSLPRMLSEGGPHVLAEMYAADLVDELCLALAPLVACGEGSRLTAGPTLPRPAPVQLATVLERDGFLFLRYVRAQRQAATRHTGS